MGVPRWIKICALPAFGLYILSVGLLFELLTGTPMAWGAGTIWLHLLVLVPLIAVLMGAILLLPVWGLLKLVRPLRQAAPAVALVAAGCAAWLLINDGIFSREALAGSGRDMLEVLRTPGAAVWGDYTDALIFVGQQALLLIVAAVCGVWGGVALVLSLVHDTFDRPPGWALAVGGLAVVAALGGAAVYGAGLVANILLVSANRQTQSEDPATRLEAIRALSRLADPRGRAYLIERLAGDDEVEVRIAAAQALGAQVGPGYAPVLIKVLPEQNPRLVVAAQDALKAILGRSKLDDRQRLDWAHEIGKLLRSKQAPIRRRAADLLIGIGPACTSTVREMLEREGETRALAIEILGKVGDEHAIGSLVWQLDQPGAIEALRAVTERVGVAMLLREASSNSAPAWYRIEKPVSEIILGMGDQSVGQLVGAACDMQMRSEGRKFARTLARKIGGETAFEGAVQCLLPMLADESSRTREIGRYELYRVGKAAVGPLVVGMQGMDPTAREEAGKVLRKLTGKRFADDANKWMDWWKRAQGSGAWK